MIPITKVISDDQLLLGKVALIVGGSGGIGKAIAKKFIESGSRVVISGTNERKLGECLKSLGGAEAIVLDVNRVSDFSEKVREAAAFFGRLDILVYCAGIHANYPGLDFLNVDEDQYDRIMDTNLKGAYFISQEVVKYFVSHDIEGHILMISSQSALEPAWSPYRLSKHGIGEITKGIAQRCLQYGIVVNGIGPGPTATSMQPYVDGGDIYTELNPIKRYTMPAEVAEYAALLASDLGNTVVGDTLYMSGGRGLIEVR